MLTTKKPNCEQIIDILPDPFVVIDRDYKILAANRAYRNHYGVENNDLLGRHCCEASRSRHTNASCSEQGELCPLEEVLNTGKPCQVVHMHYDKDNNEEYVQLQAMPIVDDDGEIMYIGEYVRVLSPQGKNDGLLVGRSPAFLKISNLLQRVAPTQSSVLLLGESGVGKEKVAKYIHFCSKRRTSPFVVVDGGMLDENLIESELFGHEKDAFTGANSHKIGLLEAADGGTLFIDEICELPLSLQAKLLRALESGTIRRIGGNGYINIDVRIIAATNRDVQRMVAEGQFRQDLYYHLSALPIHIPPLRNRQEDIIALAEHFLASLPEGKRHIPLPSEVINKLQGHDFPGNIRELRNTIERAVILACDDDLTPAHIVLEDDNTFGNGQEKARQAIEHLIQRRGRLTEQMVLDALTQCDGHRACAAKLLHVSERTLYRHIKRLRIA
ncbi:MAG: sigma-54-dependent Fis family transcriptional regulator [Gammaproteobacteria bacterium]|nr:sigma-54-dependent Fis family transcriptional regulator [Gammaproteobacteria bacterium]MCF6362586.1 sigma-54-dependent Fis family transcriptional regulator [Gammaproteobacteria bacterium]